MSNATSTTRIVRIGTEEFPYQRPWDGRALTNRGYLAFDTETEVRGQGGQIPRLALATASAGDAASALIHPEQVGPFILAHPRARFVTHNVAFDFWVVNRHLRERGEEDALAAWWDACQGNRMHDTMLLDQLIELACGVNELRPRNLADIGRRHAGLEISKDDPFRLRFGEIIGVDWDEVEDSFFEYAVRDAIVTLRAFRPMLLEAQRLMMGSGRGGPGLPDDVLARYGVLSEFVQVKGAVALAQVERHGMHVDRDRVTVAETELRAGLEAAVADLRAICPELFKTCRDPGTGESILSYTKTGTPSISEDVLRQQLAGVIEEVHAATGQQLVIPQSAKTEELSTKQEIWAEHAHRHPFVEKWLAMKDRAKLCQFFGALREPVVHPRYEILKRTGRVSCSQPNVQQVPRDSQFRHTFIPSPGRFLLAVDFSCIELRTLAAICLKFYGRSELAEVIRAGRDPHAHTAALILGVPFEVFLTWKHDETVIEINGKRQARKKHFKESRQLAKPVNFGVPGGLGAASLVSYARNNFQVDMTLEQAQMFRTKLIEEVYPELRDYLAEDDMALLAGNLGVPVIELWNAFDPEGTRNWFITCGIKNILRGKPLNAKGLPYSPGYTERVWGGLIRLCRDPDVKSLLERRRGDESLCHRLFGHAVVTLTGRIRGRLGYSQCRNTPFQGLASDGAKLALWRLIREGYRVIGFIHDEVLVELEDEGGIVSKARIDQVVEILCTEMQVVLDGSLPVECEATLSTCWSKNAELIVRDDKVYPWSPEPAAEDSVVLPAITAPIVT